MEEKNIKAIIFDMDGVMFDTERLYEEAFAMIAKKWGYESEVTEEFIKSFKGKKKEAIKAMYKTLLDKLSRKTTSLILFLPITSFFKTTSLISVK